MVFQFLQDSVQRMPTAVGSWSRELKNPIPSELWLCAGKVATCLQDPRLRSFHLMFINRGYYTNKILAKFTEVSSACSFCGQEAETYLHLYWECSYVSKLVKLLKAYCADILGTPPDTFNREEFLFAASPSTLVATITILVKKYIFQCRINKVKPFFRACMLTIRTFIRRDKLHAQYAYCVDRHYTLWQEFAEEIV